MTKESLLMWLREAFSAYPPEEVEERIRFYEEMIDDRMEVVSPRKKLLLLWDLWKK